MPTQDDIEIMFSNIHAITALSGYYIIHTREIRNKNKHFGHNSAAIVALQYILPFAYIYNQYLNGFEDAREKLQHFKTKFPDIESFIRKNEKSTQVRYRRCLIFIMFCHI